MSAGQDAARALGAMPDPDTVVYEAPGTAFHGLTLAKAKIVNGALCGRRVILVAGADWANIWSERKEVMFLRMTLPGERAPTPFSTAWECLFYRYDSAAGAAFPGSTRHVGVGLIERLIVVRAPELSPCWQCCGWFPQSALRDTRGWWADPESRLECRDCATGG